MNCKSAGGLVRIGVTYRKFGVVRALQERPMGRARPNTESNEHILMLPTAKETGIVPAVDTTLLLLKNVNICGEVGIYLGNFS